MIYINKNKTHTTIKINKTEQIMFYYSTTKKTNLFIYHTFFLQYKRFFYHI